MPGMRSIGPVAVRGARAGPDARGRDRRGADRGRGVTQAGGFDTPLNGRLGVEDGETVTLLWSLDADAATGRADSGHEVEARSVPRRHRDAAGRARHPFDGAAPAVRREHRLQGARRGYDAVPPDLRRRCAPLGRRRPRRAGRRRGVAARDRGARGAGSLTLSVRDDLELAGRSRGRRRRGWRSASTRTSTRRPRSRSTGCSSSWSASTGSRDARRSLSPASSSICG